MLDIDKGISLVKFSATWCGPCKMMASTIQKVEPEFPTVKFHDIDVDDFSNLAVDYKIRSVPTVIVFKDGEEITRLVGALKADILRKTLQGVTNIAA
jgi:thioredoxin 1